MEKIISARHFHLDEGTKEFIGEQLDSIAAKHTRLISARVTLEHHQRQHYHAEVVIHGKHLQIGAKAQANELVPAIDLAMNRARAQLLKFNDRIHDHAHVPVSQLELEHERIAEEAS